MDFHQILKNSKWGEERFLKTELKALDINMNYFMLDPLVSINRKIDNLRVQPHFKVCHIFPIIQQEKLNSKNYLLIRQ